MRTPGFHPSILYRFTGDLPSLKTLVNIRYLLLHENMLSGGLDALEFNISEHEGPVSYGARNIIALTLHSNSISGSIPSVSLCVTLLMNLPS